ETKSPDSLSCWILSQLHLPRPALSVLPGHEVLAGVDVMFRCTTTPPSTGCYLYLEGQIRAQLFSREQGDYNLSHVQKGASGRYSCQCYNMSTSIEWSAVSNTLDLVVRGETFPQPHPALLSSLKCVTSWGNEKRGLRLSVTIPLAVASEGQLHVCFFPPSHLWCRWVGSQMRGCE
uniref:Ig-like domain-containing protein n=1 Tax=Ficedula albicollis TaxID=59894 RepID=A0A803VI26_FICAL